MKTYSAPTTEEHRPASSSDPSRGDAVLLCAFPTPAVIRLPRWGEVIGRAFFAEQRVVDSEISGKHLRFARSGGAITVEDVGSRNGTFIKGEPLTAREPVPLEDGAVIRAGRTLFVFREAFEGSALPEPPLGKLVSPFGFHAARRALTRLAARPVDNVLVLGETGTGKELFARQVATALGRDRTYAEVNVAAVPENLFEAQLFGWKKGAFSGGVEAGEGIFLAHKGGTVFLDELGELPLSLQPKILRFLENRQIQPVGASKPVHVDVSIVAATNQDLEELVEENKFRRDLWARFLVRIELPPLRERPEDLYEILRALWKRRGPELEASKVEVEAMERLMLSPWRENVRELDLLVANLDPRAGVTMRSVTEVLGPAERGAGTRPLTRELVNRILRECEGNQSEAARRLGVDRAKLIRLLKRIAKDSSPKG